MERRNKARSKGRIEESSLVKAAAWAWYQHGYSHESSQMIQEYSDVSSRKTKREPLPSRYKLEAMKQLVQEKSDKVSHLLSQDDDPKSLLDSYEIERISSDLNCYIEATTHAKTCQKLCCPYKTLSSGTRSVSRVRRKTDSFDVSCKNKGKVSSQAGNNNNNTQTEMKMKKKDWKSPRGFGFMMIRNSTVICGARLDDVVDVRVKNGDSRWPEKHVAVVDVSTCRPRRI